MRPIIFFLEKPIGFRCLRLALKYLTADSIVAVTTRAYAQDDPVFNEFCQESGITLKIVDNPNSDDFLELVKRQQAILAFAVSYSKIFRAEIVRLMSGGIINLHPALLPRHGGCYPTMWSIIEGDDETGYTLHRIDNGIDTGPIIAQTRVTISTEDTGESLYAKQVYVGEKLFHDWLPQIIKGDYSTSKHTGQGCYHSKKLPHDGILPWSQPYLYLERLVRAYKHSNYPGIRAIIGERNVEVIGIERALEISALKLPGDYMEKDNHFYVRCQDQVVRMSYAP